eukprot:CAMPEP_0197851014 /NCGR_PEP_ID=MMETSP1438-20131217/16996_2 /TAXON_ID=1461541 /ORGANISM="Pterosperma sp., Strain CCMP1384" /LENGTH=60 /DNA_ID=CAMNT_0043464467 /DNA_START=697 /DNA_END=879 /DNA_ORIENTATION=-
MRLPGVEEIKALDPELVRYNWPVNDTDAQEQQRKQALCDNFHSGELLGYGWELLACVDED